MVLPRGRREDAESGDVQTTAVPYRRVSYFVIQAICVDTPLLLIAAEMAWAG